MCVRRQWRTIYVVKGRKERNKSLAKCDLCCVRVVRACYIMKGLNAEKGEERRKRKKRRTRRKRKKNGRKGKDDKEGYEMEYTENVCVLTCLRVCVCVSVRHVIRYACDDSLEAGKRDAEEVIKHVLLVEICVFKGGREEGKRNR